MLTYIHIHKSSEVAFRCTSPKETALGTGFAWKATRQEAWQGQSAAPGASCLQRKEGSSRQSPWQLRVGLPGPLGHGSGTRTKTHEGQVHEPPWLKSHKSWISYNNYTGSSQSPHRGHAQLQEALHAARPVTASRQVFKVVPVEMQFTNAGSFWL